MKEKINKMKLTITLCIVIAISFFLEMCIFNNHLFFESKFSKEQFLSLQSASLSGCKYDFNDGIVVSKDEEETPRIELNSTVKAVSLTIKTRLLEEIKDNKLGVIGGNISISDDANSRSALHIQNLCISPGTERSFRCESGGTLHTVTLELNKHNILLIVGCACCIFFVLLLSDCTMNDHTDNIYKKLYNSFKQGNTYLEKAKPDLVNLGDDIMTIPCVSKRKLHLN